MSPPPSSLATSLADIAKESGVTPAGLPHRFESMEHLLNAVLDPSIPLTNVFSGYIELLDRDLQPTSRR